MKVLFIADNKPVKEMFQPIVDCLPCPSIVLDKIDFRAIGKENPDLIVVAREETTPAERLIARCGIPTLLIPHGALLSNEKQLWCGTGKGAKFQATTKLIKQGYMKMSRGDLDIIRLFRVGMFRLMNDFRDGATLSKYDNYTKIAVYGDFMKEVLVAYGVNPENIVVTGNPKYTKYYRMIPKRSRKVLLIMDYLVEFGLWSKSQRLNYLRDICGVVYDLTSQNVQVLIHPVLENKQEYEDMIKQYSLYADVYQMELTRLIDECEVAITLVSTSGLEVMVARKPLVIYNPYNNVMMYDADSGAYFVETKESLHDIVDKLLRDGIDETHRNLMDNYIYRQTYLRDGKADRRIADLIISMVKGGNENG